MLVKADLRRWSDCPLMAVWIAYRHQSRIARERRLAGFESSSNDIPFI